MKKIILTVKGMQCINCAKNIDDKLSMLNGVSSKSSFNNNNIVIHYDENKTSLNEIKKVITNLGFNILEISKTDEKKSINKIDFTLEILIIILGTNLLIKMLIGIDIIASIWHFINNIISNVPIVTDKTSYFMLFVIGILTSFHCVAMCGGINVTQCLANKNSKTSSISPNLNYNLGRVTSYTILGGFVGAIGSVFTLSISSTAVLYVIVGVFMVLMGINLYGINLARKLLPKMPRIFNLNSTNSSKSSYIIGVLNGFMPCGPLQSMQLYALSTGSFIDGALSMFVFSIGTVPFMYLFGKIGDFKNPSISKHFMKISAILVITLGFIMTNRGLALLGINISVDGMQNNENVSTNIADNSQIIYTDLQPSSYPNITVEKDIPVKWVINATEETLNGCNNEIIIQEYDIRQPLSVGNNIIEFTPDKTGTYMYSCWMGMIKATITVVD